MPKKHQPIKVIKVPLNKAPFDKPQVFPKMPRLYLELLENKAKIKQDLINTEYFPKENLNSNILTDEKKYSDADQPNINTVSRTIDNKKDYNSSSQNGDFEDRLNILLSDKNEESENNDKTIENVSPSVLSTVSINSDISYKEKNINEGYSSDNSEDLSVRLKQLLNDDSNSEASFYTKDKSQDDTGNKKDHKRDKEKYSNSSEKYSRHRDKKGHTVRPANEYNSAPTLAELERQGGYVPKRELRDINSSAHYDTQEEDNKRELLFKFDLLRKSYPGSTIPEYSIHTELNTMQKSYNDTVRRL